MSKSTTTVLSTECVLVACHQCDNIFGQAHDNFHHLMGGVDFSGSSVAHPLGEHG